MPHYSFLSKTRLCCIGCTSIVDTGWAFVFVLQHFKLHYKRWFHIQYRRLICRGFRFLCVYSSICFWMGFLISLPKFLLNSMIGMLYFILKSNKLTSSKSDETWRAWQSTFFDMTETFLKALNKSSSGNVYFSGAPTDYNYPLINECSFLYAVHSTVQI